MQKWISVSVLFAICNSSNAGLILTEIMYNPASSDTGWEWVELYNSGIDPVNIRGYFIEDATTGKPASIDQNQTDSQTTILAGETVILYEGEQSNLQNDPLLGGWGSHFKAIGVNGWNDIRLNNSISGSKSETVSLWSSASATDPVLSFNFSQISGISEGQSIFLTDVSADNPYDFTNWDVSTLATPDIIERTVINSGGSIVYDYGTPGLLPNSVIATPIPAALPLFSGALGWLWFIHRRKIKR